MFCCVVSQVASNVMRRAFIRSFDAQTATVPTPEETYNVSLVPYLSRLVTLHTRLCRLISGERLIRTDEQGWHLKSI